MLQFIFFVSLISLILRHFGVTNAVTLPSSNSKSPNCSDNEVCLNTDSSTSSSSGDDYGADHSDDDDSLTRDNHPVWWNYSIDELFEKLFRCGDIIYGYNVDNNAETPDPTSESEIKKIMQQLTTIREKYMTEVNLVPLQMPTPENDYSIMMVPVKIGDAGPGKGRGIFSTEPIKKGSLVASLDVGNVGIFKEGHSWRKFVATLPRETACNFIEWCWIQDVPPVDGSDNDIRDGLTVFVAFDISNLINAADWDADQEANVYCGQPLTKSSSDYEKKTLASEKQIDRGPCRFEYYAARDIKPDEEILINYGEFEDVDQHHWREIGL